MLISGEEGGKDVCEEEEGEKEKKEEGQDT